MYYLFQGRVVWVGIGAKIGNFVLKFYMHYTIHSAIVLVRIRALFCWGLLVGLEGGKEEARFSEV